MAKEITLKDLHTEILSNRKEIKNIEKVLTSLVKDVAATNKILVAHQFDNIAFKNMYMREEHPEWMMGNRLMDRSDDKYEKEKPKKH